MHPDAFFGPILWAGVYGNTITSRTGYRIRYFFSNSREAFYTHGPHWKIQVLDHLPCPQTERMGLFSDPLAQ